MIDRRLFIEGLALVSISPVLPTLFSVSPPARPFAAESSATVPEELAASHNDLNSPLFRIQGWEQCHGGQICSSNENQAVVRITSSWRAAWR
jgi:hypothetical protein